MSFANHNILDIALSIIPPTVVQIRKNLGTSINKYGQAEAAYSEWIEVYGIVQPGAEQNQHTQGVDFSKKRVTIWLRGISLDGTHIQWAPDQIRYVGAIYNVVGVKDWYPYDNYKECECVEALNLGPNQRGVRAMVSGNKKTQREVYENQAEVEIPQTVQPPMPNRKPSIFVPDSDKEKPIPKIEPAKNPPLVGKARIRF
jgi:hypothetical protein